jgi:2'-5' RNA ligase
VSARSFVAIAVPDPVRDVLAASTASLRRPGADLRTTDPAGWHLTLAFLGALDDGRLTEVADVVAEVVQRHAPRPAPWLALGSPGRFGDRVLVAHVEEHPSGSLGALVALLRAALEGAGLALPPEGFRPHVTLARARAARRVTAGDVASLRVPAARWQPTTVGVWATAASGDRGPYAVRSEVDWPAGSASPAAGAGGR